MILSNKNKKISNWAFFITITTRALSVLSTICSTYVITHYFNDKDLSSFYLLAPFTGLATMVLISPISILVNNYEIINGGLILNRLTSLLQYLLFIAIILSSYVFLYFKNTGIEIELAIYIFIEVISGTLIGYIVQSESYLGNHLKSSLTHLLINATLSIIPLILVYNLDYNFYYWILGIIFARIIQFIFVFNYVFYWKFKNLENIFILIFQNKKSVLILIIMSLFGWCYNNLIKLISLNYSENYLQEILFYSTSSLSIVTILESIFRSYIDRNIYIISGENLKKIKYIYLVIFLIALAFGPLAMYLISSNRFPDLLIITPLILLYEVFRSYSNNLQTLVQIKSGYDYAFILNISYFLIYFLSVALLFFYIKNEFFRFFWIYSSLTLISFIYINIYEKKLISEF